MIFSKDLMEKELSDRKHFYRSLKDETTNDKGETLDSQITDEEYLTFVKIWNRFNMKNMVDYHDHGLKKGCVSISRCF